MTKGWLKQITHWCFVRLTIWSHDTCLFCIHILMLLMYNCTCTMFTPYFKGAFYGEYYQEYLPKNRRLDDWC